jgi:CRISPR/Cas system-associated exonuclease Cas4 (RecB family)
MSGTHLSASLYRRFQVCPQSALFSISPESRSLNRPSLRAALGLIAHKLLEEASIISQDWSTEEIDKWFEINWQQILEKQYSELAAQWYPQRVPVPTSWPGYFLTRASSKTLAIRNRGIFPLKASSKKGNDIRKKEIGSLTFPLVEQLLVSDELKIMGRPDLVVIEEGLATILDYKFGSNVEEVAKYQTQMYFYKLLLENITNIRVGKMVIVSGANREIDVHLDEKELRKLESDIPRVADALNSKNVTASPSVLNCGFCPFKSICQPFKNAKIYFFPGRPMAISGKVEEVREIDDEFQELTIKNELGEIQDEYKVFSIPRAYQIARGSQVFLADNLDFRDEKVVRFSWNSRISVIG